MFKKLVNEIANITDRDASSEEVNEVCGKISKAFDQGKISWSDYELLFKLIDSVTE